MAEEVRIVIPRERLCWTYGGVPHYDAEGMLAQLLLNGVCRLGGGRLEDAPALYAFVICSDVFIPHPDGESIRYEDLPALYEMHMADPRWGAYKWCILRRKRFPQGSVLEQMREAGAWDIDESLLRLRD